MTVAQSGATLSATANGRCDNGKAGRSNGETGGGGGRGKRDAVRRDGRGSEWCSYSGPVRARNSGRSAVAGPLQRPPRTEQPSSSVSASEGHRSMKPLASCPVFSVLLINHSATEECMLDSEIMLVIHAVASNNAQRPSRPSPDLSIKRFHQCGTAISQMPWRPGLAAHLPSSTSTATSILQNQRVALVFLLKS